MKYHSIFTPALTSLCLLVTSASLASNSTVLPVKDPARWFEIEIILFKQISTKNKHKEQFNAQNLLSKTHDAHDLLAPYLQPNIASLKQLLPICGQPSAIFPYGIDVETVDLNAKEEQNQEIESDLTSQTAVNERNEKTAEVVEYTNDLNDDEIAIGKSDNKTSSMSVALLPSLPNEDSISNVTAAISGKTDEQYATKILPRYNLFPSDSKAPLCIISSDFFQQNLTDEQLAQFSIDGFPVKALTSTINGIEQWRDDENGEITWASQNPYLISQDSLRLKSIANRIKRSRNYAPLLHLGWRQVGETRRKAKAMKVYAGDHLTLKYQEALAEQTSQQTSLAIDAILDKRQEIEALIADQALMDNKVDHRHANSINHNDNAATPLPSERSLTELSHSENVNAQVNTLDGINTVDIPFKELSIEEELKQQAQKQQLDKLFEQYSLLNNDNNKIDNEDFVQSIVAQLSTDINTPVKPLLSDNVSKDKPVSIEAPIQPWSLDGLFKVHLDHYLYINSELNLVEEQTITGNDDNSSDNTSVAQQVITFKQDRRVISGEIHYFDHPHIGMVVQIRRFDPTKPAAEAVSQSKK